MSSLKTSSGLLIWIAIAVAAGSARGATLLHYGREVLTPVRRGVWVNPSAESVCVFFDNVTPQFQLDNPGKV